jgi:hypothetical protein
MSIHQGARSAKVYAVLRPIALQLLNFAAQSSRQTAYTLADCALTD